MTYIVFLWDVKPCLINQPGTVTRVTVVTDIQTNSTNASGICTDPW